MSNRRLRILFDAHALLGRKTGVGYYTYQLILELAKEHPYDLELIGYYHNFLYRKPTSNLPTAPNIRYRPVAFMPGQIVNLLRRFHLLLPVELLTLTRADFIFYPNFLGLASLFKTPSANVIHDLTYIDLPEYVAKKNLSDLRHFIPDNIRRASFLVTVSEFGKKRIHKEFSTPLQNILVTPIPPSRPIIYSKAEREAILRSLPIPGKYFLTLSTVEPRKNVLGMLDAYLRLPKELRKEYTLVITGAIGWNCDEEIGRLRQLTEQGENIVHVGYVTDEQRAALYQGATFYTSASHYEGFGMTPLEAMSYGTACALSNIPVFQEIAGDNVLYFDKDRSETIANAWRKLLLDEKLRSRLAQAGKQHAATYNWNNVAASLYNRIMQTLENSK